MKELTNSRRKLSLSNSPPTKPLEALALLRRLVAKLVAIRTGHGDFRAYHERFNHPESEWRCSCGSDKVPEHLFKCRKVRAKRSAWPDRLRGVSAATAFKRAIARPTLAAELAKASRFYEEI